MAVLYRKYRPQTFSEVLGQKHIVQTLKNQVVAASVAHAYLFTGSRGVGKTSLARILAKAVNCEKKNTGGDACGECSNCKAIAQGNFLDLVEIDAASNTGVDNIRDLIEHVKFAPSIGKYKVFIIDEVHMLSKGAFNALLKTLEEPPKHAIFILATTEIGKVPATIISRSQRFDFQRLSVEDLVVHLEKITKAEKLHVPKEVLQLIAERADGGVRDALSLLDKLSTLGASPALEDAQRLLGIIDIAHCEKLLAYIAEGDGAAIPEFFNGLFENGLEPGVFNRDFLEYLRKLLIVKVTGGGQQSGLSGAHAKTMVAFTDQFSLAQLIFIIRLFLKSYKDLPYSPTPDIPLLLAALEAAAKPGLVPASGVKAPAVQAKPIQTTAQASEKAVVSEFAFTAVLEPSPALPVLEEIIEVPVVASDVRLEEIQKIWPAALDKLKSINGPLANLVKNSPIQNVSGGIVTLGVKYLFHKQNVENSKNSRVIGDVLQGLLHKAVGVRAQVVKLEQPAETSTPAEALSDALKIFGGELVE